MAFTRLTLLLDENVRGRDLIPVFLEYGRELTQHFDLDPRTLEAIINGSLDDPEKRVDREDIELISTLPRSGYPSRAKLNGPFRQQAGELRFPDALKHHLYEKYVAPRNRFVGLDNVLSSFLQVPL